MCVELITPGLPPVTAKSSVKVNGRNVNEDFVTQYRAGPPRAQLPQEQKVWVIRTLVSREQAESRHVGWGWRMKV